MSFQSSMNFPKSSSDDASRMPITIMLYFPVSSEHIELEIMNRAILGRASSPNDAGVTYLDLTTIGGYQHGVSRRHLMLVNDARIGLVAFDLKSQNGSSINDQPMSPHTGYPVHDGDLLRLGTLEVQCYTTDGLSATHASAGESMVPTPPSIGSATRRLPEPKPDIRNTLQMPSVHVDHNKKHA